MEAFAEEVTYYSTYVPLFDVYHDTGRQQHVVVEFNFDIEWALSLGHSIGHFSKSISRKIS